MRSQTSRLSMRNSRLTLGKRQSTVLNQTATQVPSQIERAPARPALSTTSASNEFLAPKALPKHVPAAGKLLKKYDENLNGWVIF